MCISPTVAMRPMRLANIAPRMNTLSRRIRCALARVPWQWCAVCLSMSQGRSSAATADASLCSTAYNSQADATAVHLISAANMLLKLGEPFQATPLYERALTMTLTPVQKAFAEEKLEIASKLRLREEMTLVAEASAHANEAFGPSRPCPVPHAPCPVLRAPCPLPHALMPTHSRI